jgi:hypothetical protein
MMVKMRLEEGRKEHPRREMECSALTVVMVQLNGAGEMMTSWGLECRDCLDRDQRNE